VKTSSLILTIGLGSLGLMLLSGDGKPTIVEPSLPPELDARARVLRAALNQIGTQNPDKYWADVAPTLVGSGLDWCGGFTLWALHQAGLGRHIQWIPGDGYMSKYLPTTKSPKPGDMLYIHEPFQHQAIVTRIEGDRVFSLDGNQPGESVEPRDRALKDITVFYSIEPLIQQAMAA
jgi:hypothetical protein